MKIKMLTLLAGPEGTVQPGMIIDLPSKRAKALIEGGFAVAEKAKAKAKETAALNEDERETRGDDVDQASDAPGDGAADDG